MNDLCKLSGGEFGPCQGSMLRLDDNAKMYPTVYCEYHARMVTAWIAETPREPGPIHKFLDKLSAEGWQKFRATMESVTLDSFIPFVPHLTQRALDVGYAPAQEVAFQPDLLSTAPAKSKPARRK